MTQNIVFDRFEKSYAPTPKSKLAKAALPAVSYDGEIPAQSDSTDCLGRFETLHGTRSDSSQELEIFK